MKNIWTTTRAVSACITVIVLAACAGPAKKPAGPLVEKDVSRVINLADGTTCTEPAGLAESRASDGAVKLKALLDSGAKPAEVLDKAKEIKPKRDEVEAVYFDACRAYSKAEIKKPQFDDARTVYFGLRQQLFAQDVKQWQDKKDGIADAGKLCLVQLSDSDPEHRSFTRVIPPESTVSDCAELAVANGSSEILLGCTKGHWDNTWAKSPIGLSGNANRLHQMSAKGASHIPDPNCGWN